MIKVISDTPHLIKIWASDLEAEAEKQLRNLATLPFIHDHVAVMADAHAGRGSTVGTVIATRGAIIPSAVGLDVGCGMMAMRMPFNSNHLGGDISALRHSIERSVPVGRFGNKECTPHASNAFLALGENSLGKDSTRILTNASLQLGSLGGGNHFIEVCIDESNSVWIMLHSGSRNIGKCLAERHIDKAKDLMKQYFISLPDPDLAYLAQNTPEFKAYLTDLMWAQKYAAANREEMMRRIIEQIYRHVYKDKWAEELMHVASNFKVHCHHNYTNIEHHAGHNVYVTRKGAVSAKDGEWGIIPGSMGTSSYIVQGLGNADSFHSCSHGAGRKMSRTKARATFTVEDLEKQTAGVECRKDKDVIDEIPGSYKDINIVMENQADLVKPVFKLRQILCVKG